MYKPNWGSKNQISFNDEHEYYELLGYLAKSDGTSSIVWERNDQQGAWGSEGRLQFYTNDVPVSASMLRTAGSGNISFRVNCNEFVANIVTNHKFAIGKEQDVATILSTVPTEYQTDFNRGLNSSTEEIEEEQSDENDVLMERPFDPTKIKIETKTPSLDTLIKRIKNKTVRLNTESYFQRKDDLWDKKKQSRLIESILIQFPLPAFFFDATDENEWLVVDGLQRLSSIRNFVVDKTLILNDLEFLTQLNGCRWDDLSQNLKTAIEESQVVIYKILPGTPTDVKFNIFKRINTGGLVLEPQEIRHALFQGKPATFIAELAKSPEFLNATGGKIDTSRMLDRDFANRFLCFYLFGTDNYATKEYGQDLDSFMSKAMAYLYTTTDSETDKIEYDFKQAMILSKNIFGKEAFRKVYYRPYYKLPSINKALFDAISVQFALLSDEERNVLLHNKEEVKEKIYQELHKEAIFFVSVTSSTGDRNRVSERHKIVKNIINEIINNEVL